MCGGKLSVVETAGLTGSHYLTCGHHAHLIVNTFACVGCFEHEGSKMVGVSLIAEGEGAEIMERTAVGDLTIADCNLFACHTGSHLCPACQMAHDTETDFKANPSTFLITRDLTCPVCQMYADLT